MKNRIILLVLMLLCAPISQSFAQETTILMKDDAGHYYYERVMTVAGTKKEAMYKAIKEWVRKNIKSTDKVSYDDATQENINLTAALATANGTATEFKLNIDIKDDKYKISATSLMWHGYGKINPLGDYSGLMVPGGQKKKILASFETEFSNVVKSIENAARNANTKSEW